MSCAATVLHVARACLQGKGNIQDSHHCAPSLFFALPCRAGFEGMGRAELRAWCQGQIARYKVPPVATALAACHTRSWVATYGYTAAAAAAAASCCYRCGANAARPVLPWLADPTVLEVCGLLPNDCLRQASGAASCKFSFQQTLWLLVWVSLAVHPLPWHQQLRLVQVLLCVSNAAW